jgi:8-oxo-dGTP pyrophosphatase MutT (NUDIX family)
MLFGDGTPEAPLASATVVLLRDGPRGLEVFMLRRHGLSDVLGGAYVFPGGKVDRQDAASAARLDRPLDALCDALGEPALTADEAASLHVAAIREVFEESGVLFAEGVQDARQDRTFAQLISSPSVRLLASRLVPWSRWITPRASFRARKHFDARFFVALLPSGEQAVHDEHETTESTWVSPREALQDYWARRVDLPPPQIMTLVQLARHDSAASVLAQARGRTPPVVQPEATEEDGARLVCYPGDALHPSAVRVLPGPTRLYWRTDRYEPAGGVEDFFR